MYNAAEEAQVRKAEKQAELALREYDAYMKDVLSTRQGRAFIFNILAKTGLKRSPFSKNSKVMAFNAGQMNVGLQIEADIIRVQPEAYIFMMREAYERDSSNNGTNSGRNSDDNGRDAGAADGDAAGYSADGSAED